ncbi:MAG: two-component sensor histidine kinase [Legionellales bacterium]|nr:two-component sensor histidine kinase [Legionellales bacterium]|tara:strand:- start:4851 stop:6245 length:1395 start_codon:yes stop_codon:yes gene_type:complete
MIPSIRKFLLINLLLSITVTTTLTAIGNYILDQKDIQYHLDSLLSQSAMSFMALLNQDFDTSDLLRMQSQLNSIPNIGKQYADDAPFDFEYEDKFQFQVWNDSGELLIHSANSPLEPLSNFADGFSNAKIHNQPWRVFTTRAPQSDLIVVVAERYDTRAELGHRIARDDIYIMLLTYPLLGLLIWIIIGKGLSPLKTAAIEVAKRQSSNLEPVDLTSVPEEIKPLVDELNKLLLRLEGALEREKRFAADAAHELRTPLAALKGQAQLAIKATDPKEANDALSKLITGVDRCTHIVQQLLTLSRIVPDEEQRIQDARPIKLRNVAIEQMAQLAPTALEKNIDLELNCKDEKLKVMGNFTALGILLRNLIDNAIRYSPENSFVKVDIYREGKRAILKVTDNGPGIPAELRSRVFERFYRVLGTKQKGSGLGLAIVQQIASLHKAELLLGTPPTGQGLEIKLVFQAL